MKRRKERREEKPEQRVTPLTRLLLNGPEIFALVKGVPVLTHRGGVPFMKVLDQAFDGENVIALELTIGATAFPLIRRLDKKLSDKVLRIVAKDLANPDERRNTIEVRLSAIIG